MKNTNLEFLKITSGKPIKCAFIEKIEYNISCDVNSKVFNLKLDYSDSDLSYFLQAINFDYDEKAIHIFGVVWLADNTWITVNEGIDWKHNKIPYIPDFLK